MNTSAFMLSLVGVLALGGALGGAFVGGIALGKSQEPEAAESAFGLRSTSGSDQPSSEQPSLESLAQLRQRLQSGELSPEELAQVQEQFQGRFGQDGDGFTPGNALAGTIGKVDGNVITINTAQGPLRATIAEGTTVQTTTEVPLADLLEGMRITVSGEPGDGGTIQATSIFVLPEDAGSLPAGGFRGGPRGGQR